MSQRRDARANRERLLSAARDVFRESGASSPLGAVAERAGVGRGTLYRHFPDRAALFAAVFRARLEALERFVSGYPDGDVLERLLVEICWYEVWVPGLGSVLGGLRMTESEDLRRVAAETAALLGVALERSHDADVVRRDVTVADMLMCITMLHGVSSEAEGRVPDAVLRRALAIVLDGIRTPTRVGAPVPEPELPPEP